MIQLSTADGHTLSAYRADPPGAPKGAVVVLQEMFGLTDHIRKTADDFAARGYVAVAPALFDRVQPDVALSYDEEGFARGVSLMEDVGRERALNDIQAAVDAVKDAGKVAIVGFSWGGYLAYEGGNQIRDVACTIGYYAAGVVGMLGEKRRVPTLLHFGENDPLLPMELVHQFRDRRPDVSAFSYPGATHGFTCAERGTYNAEATGKALDRTLSWISQYVEGQAPVQLKNAGAYAQAKTEKKKSKKPEADDLGPPMD